MPDLSGAQWRKSTFTGANSCVEVADNLPGIIAVRNSNDPDGPTVVFTPAEWTAFIKGVHAGEF